MAFGSYFSLTIPAGKVPVPGEGFLGFFLARPRSCRASMYCVLLRDLLGPEICGMGWIAPLLFLITAIFFALNTNAFFYKPE